ncbi:MAG: endopeptidase La, partial [Armatimonadota bacterium]
EQLKAIQSELGERDSGAEVVAEYRRRIALAGMPERSERAALREADRLARTPPASPESGVSRNYLDTLLEVPWSTVTTDVHDLGVAAEVLERGHFGLHDVKERILDFLAVRRLAGGDARSPVLCFAGPPGVGKTSLARSVAEALGRRFVRVSLGGVRDEAEIRGHRRTYLGAMPGRIVKALKQAGTRNPVILLDEIDKMGSDHRGDPAAALLEVLDPEQNAEFVDHYLEVPVDLSDVLFVATANLLDPLPPALRDRLEVVPFAGYIEREKVEIALRHLLPRQRLSHGLAETAWDLDGDAVTRLVREYTREAGVRHLDRRIETLCRKAARRIVEGGPEVGSVSAEDLESLIGHPSHHWGTMGAVDLIGSATGMAFTESGGDIISVEVQTLPSRGGDAPLVLTGQLGGVMRESAQTAWTLVRSRAAQLEIAGDAVGGREVHVHVPAAAVPKDGPSAGATIAVAMASVFTGRAVRRDVAMTGEITLRGNVLPVGGIKEKVLAAHRAGITTVLLPVGNRGDLDDLPEEVRSAIEFVLVEDIDRVFASALR